jgi:copper homeostasis protein (lipoprotein)
MKPLHILLSMAIATAASCKTSNKAVDNSRTSLDWKGTYTGVTPCADCEGILTKITLHDDNTYSLQTRYLGKSEEIFSSNGRFEWSREGNRIALKNAQEGTGPMQYQLGENKLTQLDLNGQAITGDLAVMYVLSKEGTNDLSRYWKLIEVNGSAVVPKANQRKEPHMILHTQDKRVNGSGGCNNFTGSFQLQPANRLSFSPLAATKMFCPDAQQTEDLLFKALQNTDSYYVSGDTLQLIRARMAPLAKFVAVYLR